MGDETPEWQVQDTPVTGKSEIMDGKREGVDKMIIWEKLALGYQERKMRHKNGKDIIAG